MVRIMELSAAANITDTSTSEIGEHQAQLWKKDVVKYGEALRRCSKLFNFSEDQQERLAKLAVQRNRLAHRYLNFRWQAIEMYKKEAPLAEKLINLILDREERK